MVSTTLRLVKAHCCICEHDDATPVAAGEDFEYRTSADTFLAVRCRQCGLVYLDPRPSEADFATIYPPSYHAFAFDSGRYGFVHRARRWLESRRLQSWLRALRRDALIVDLGCGDGFHLGVLRSLGYSRAIGIDLSDAAVARARRAGFDAIRARAESDVFPAQSVDAALMIQTIEHVEEPLAVIESVRRMLRPGGRLFVVTDNTGSADRLAFAGRHWGGYHFPRHLTLFDRRTLRALGEKAGLRVRSIRTMPSPVNWTYSVRNALVDRGAPQAICDCFSLHSVPALGCFTILDFGMAAIGRGALLCAQFER